MDSFHTQRYFIYMLLPRWGCELGFLEPVCGHCTVANWNFSNKEEEGFVHLSCRIDCRGLW